MKSMSNRRAAEQRERRKVLARLVEERGPWCQAAMDGCTGTAVDGHEVLARSAGGSITDPTNILLVCRWCHDVIGAYPLQAEALGLRKSRYA